MRRHANPGRGSIIVVAGPDGAGKSMLAAEIAARLPAGSVRRVHHRFGVLPGGSAAAVPTSEPHAQAPYSPWLTRVKIVYLFVDFLLGWSLRARPFVNRGGVVIIERGWFDLVVDPRRYRLHPDVMLARRLASVLPSADRLFILDAPSETIVGRKSELDVAEVERQSEVWRSIGRQQRGTVLLDATRAAADVVEQAIRAMPAADDSDRPAPAASPSRVRSWVGLPPGKDSRWVVPAGPPRLAQAALRVHHPITFRAVVTWHVARAFARSGSLALLPKTTEPELQAALARFIPPGGCVAVAYKRRRGRAVALIMDASGHARALAKIAQDPRGREKLAREADAVLRLGSRVQPPLYAPRLLARSEDVIVFDAVDWYPRWRTWELPIELAAAIGRFHAAGADGAAGLGLAHGDFAPWNVLRTRNGWSLVDWEDAHEHALPFEDVYHYLVQAHALLGRPTQRALIEGVHGSGKVGALLGAYADAAGLAMSDAPARFADYLCASLELADTTPAGERGIGARRRLLADLGHSA